MPTALSKIESDHGRSRLPGVTSGENHAGAGDPMQFLKPTWNGARDSHDPRAAIWNYNHSDTNNSACPFAHAKITEKQTRSDGQSSATTHPQRMCGPFGKPPSR